MQCRRAEIRNCEYLNNTVEQAPLVERGRRFVKRKMIAAVGFQAFRPAKDTPTRRELVRVTRKGQVRPLTNASNVDHVYVNALARTGEPDDESGCRLEKFATEPPLASQRCEQMIKRNSTTRSSGLVARRHRAFL